MLSQITSILAMMNLGSFTEHMLLQQFPQSRMTFQPKLNQHKEFKPTHHNSLHENILLATTKNNKTEPHCPYYRFDLENMGSAFSFSSFFTNTFLQHLQLATSLTRDAATITLHASSEEGLTHVPTRHCPSHIVFKQLGVIPQHCCCIMV